MELLDTHVAKPNADEQTFERILASRQKPPSQGLHQSSHDDMIDAAHDNTPPVVATTAAAGWTNGYEGRAAAAGVVHELLMAAGMSGEHVAVSGAACQANLYDEAHGNRGWAEPIPHSWTSIVATLAPLPMGILSAKRTRTLIWAIYLSRLDSEPGLTRIELSTADEKERRASTSFGAVVYGGATDVLAKGEELAQIRLPARDQFCEFVLDWLQHEYGGRSLAAAQLTSLVAALRKHINPSTDDPRLRTFARLCGASEESAFGQDTASFMIRAMHLSLSLTAGSTAHFPLDARMLLSLERTLAVIHALFGEGPEPRPLAEEKLREALVAISNGRGGSSGRASIDLDEFMLMCVLEHEATKRAPRVRASLISLFALADVNHDGVLSHEELQLLMNDQGRTNREATVLYYKMQKAEHESRADAPPSAALKSSQDSGISVIEFIEFCADLGFTTDPRPIDSQEAAELDVLEKEWLARQSHVASMLGQLRAHVRETGGHVPTAYPSGALLRRARASLVDLSTQLGAFAHGMSADPKGVRARLDELHATIDRAEVAIAVESAGRSDDF